MMKKTNNTSNTTVTDYLQRYLETLRRIEKEKQTLKDIEEEAAKIPGVEKRPFKSIARAMHDAPGEIEFKLASMNSFIQTAFKRPDNGSQEIDFE